MTRNDINFKLIDEIFEYLPHRYPFLLIDRVTELVSGVEIVREQFRIASGESIDMLNEKHDGYSVKRRLYALKHEI